MKTVLSFRKAFRSSPFTSIRRYLTISNDYKGVIEQFTSRTEGRNVMLVRHGESYGNLQRELYGNTDYELTEKGIQQAKFLAQHFKGTEDKFTSISSSMLQRAWRTCELAFGEPKDFKYYKTAKFNEINLGTLEGIKVEEDLVRFQIYTMYIQFTFLILGSCITRQSFQKQRQAQTCCIESSEASRSFRNLEIMSFFAILGLCILSFLTSMRSFFLLTTLEF